jgi:hypothetical protein
MPVAKGIQLMPVKIRDLMAAEQRLDEAEAEVRKAQNPDEWSAHESVDKLGKRTIHLAEGHFEKLDYLRKRVEVAENELRQLQRAFARGEDPGARGVPTIDGRP